MSILIGQYRFGRHHDRYRYSREIYSPFDTAHLEDGGFLLKMEKKRSRITKIWPLRKNLKCRALESLRVHLVDVVGYLESGNHDYNSFDYIVFRLDWVKCAGEVLGH